MGSAKKGTKDRKTLSISVELHSDLKEVADRAGMKLHAFADRCLRSGLKSEREFFCPPNTTE